MKLLVNQYNKQQRQKSSYATFINSVESEKIFSALPRFCNFTTYQSTFYEMMLPQILYSTLLQLLQFTIIFIYANLINGIRAKIASKLVQHCILLLTNQLAWLG